MSLFNELKRRNVFRVGLAYMVSAWIIAQVAGLVLDSIEAAVDVLGMFVYQQMNDKEIDTRIHVNAGGVVEKTPAIPAKAH